MCTRGMAAVLRVVLAAIRRRAEGAEHGAHQRGFGVARLRVETIEQPRDGLLPNGTGVSRKQRRRRRLPLADYT